MTLNQILYFQTVARHQHFRLAAAELSISQPSLSRSIAVLEEELGIILFERKGAYRHPYQIWETFFRACRPDS